MLLGVGYPKAGLTPLRFGDLFTISLLSTLDTFLLVFMLVSFAEDKVAGFAVPKMIQAVMLLPVAAYFIGSSLQNLAGVTPSYWVLSWAVRVR